MKSEIKEESKANLSPEVHKDVVEELNLKFDRLKRHQKQHQTKEVALDELEKYGSLKLDPASESKSRWNADLYVTLSFFHLCGSVYG